MRRSSSIEISFSQVLRGFTTTDNAGLGALVDLATGDRARGILHIGLAAAELAKAAARARDANRHLDRVALGLLELLGHRLGDRKHRARTVDPHGLGLGHRRAAEARCDYRKSAQHGAANVLNLHETSGNVLSRPQLQPAR